MDRIDRLEAIEDIKALKGRYFRALDTRNFDALEQVFAPDLIADFRLATSTTDESGLSRGLEAYLAKVEPILQNVSTVHHGYTPEIEIHSLYTASAIWAMEEKSWPHSDSSLPFVMQHGYGHYHERYVRFHGQWLISEMKLMWLRIDIQTT